MARWRRLSVAIWSDADFSGFSVPEKLVWIYLLTNDECNLVGLYRLDLDRAARRLCLPAEALEGFLARQAALGKVLWDGKANLVWLRRWLNHQPPEGPKQLSGYYAALDEFGGHPFAGAVRLLLWPHAEEILGPRYLTQQQAILVRDGCACVYCRQPFAEWADFKADRLDPASAAVYSNLVAACKACRQAKGDRTAEQFGWPFLRGRDYSTGQAARTLLQDSELRDRFQAVCHGLPEPLESSGLDVVRLCLSNNSLPIPYRNTSDSEKEKEREERKEKETPAPRQPNAAGRGGLSHQKTAGPSKAEKQAFIDQWRKRYGPHKNPTWKAEKRTWLLLNLRATQHTIKEILAAWAVCLAESFEPDHPLAGHHLRVFLSSYYLDRYLTKTDPNMEGGRCRNCGGYDCDHAADYYGESWPAKLAEIYGPDRAASILAEWGKR